ncbi:MAG TPA: TraR/DksA family transcriptional regulator [Sandaracinaceae bacterium LLY-WYZ-13_1]|nr:TraR/DksA family transcriptional regulator [Sandaracinaceae bacterium LLY-WYZ-13_1]
MADESAVAAHPDAGLSPREVAELHQRLLAEHERLRTALTGHRREAHETGRVFADEADAAIHERHVADLADATERRRRMLEDVEAALGKLADGTYGLCEATDEPIGRARLRVTPWARYAVAYQELVERRVGHGR